jgi:hypothetical protein
MLIVNLLVNEKLINAEFALNQATSANIVELCRKYLALLTEYRDELFKLRSAPELTQPPLTPLARELTEQVRNAIRSAVEITTRERNKTESMLESFTAISGYEAIETFNQLKYKGFDTWELRAGGARLKDSVGDQPITIQEAVETAGLLRREAYVTDKTTFFKN